MLPHFKSLYYTFILMYVQNVPRHLTFVAQKFSQSIVTRTEEVWGVLAERSKCIVVSHKSFQKTGHGILNWTSHTNTILQSVPEFSEAQVKIDQCFLYIDTIKLITILTSGLFILQKNVAFQLFTVREKQMINKNFLTQ